MKYQGYELNSMDKLPLTGQKCLVVMEKNMTYLKTNENGHSEWKEDLDPKTQKFIGWLPI